jgi:hypothetical protein
LYEPGELENEGLYCGYALKQAAAAMKNNSFHQEKEWRLVSSYTNVANQADAEKLPIKFLPGNGTLRSYFEWPLSPPHEVKKILIGPKIQAELTKPVLGMLLKENKYKNVEILPATVSLR